MAERVEHKFGPGADDEPPWDVPLQHVDVGEVNTQRESAIAEALTKADNKSPHWKKAAAKAKSAAETAARIERKKGSAPVTDHHDSAVYR